MTIGPIFEDHLQAFVDRAWGARKGDLDQNKPRLPSTGGKGCGWAKDGLGYSLLVPSRRKGFT